MKITKTTIEVVKFHDDFLEVVRVAANGAVGKVDGEYWVSVRKVCENLDIHFSYQLKKLKSEEAFEAKYIEVQTKGGLQKVFCIPLEKLNGWLFTINPNKVKPEVKQKLIAYKNECFKVLYNHFIQKAAQPPVGCPAEHFDSRINGYKGMIARKNKEIERLEYELAIAKDEVKRANESAKYLDKLREKEKKLKHQAIMLEHNILDFAASYARLKEELLERAKTLKFIATEFEKRIENVDYFLQSIYKIFPKAKDVADNASKRHKKEIEFHNLMIKRS